MKSQTKATCVGCDGQDLLNFFRAERVPVDVGFLADSVDNARNATCGTLSLDYCRECGLVHNRSFSPELIQFRPGYDASLIHSPRYQHATDSLAQTLVDKYDLNDKTVLDIGCGQGHLLRAIAIKSRVEAIGVDPTVHANREQLGSSRLRLLPGRLEELRLNETPHLVVCVSVLEDIQHPQEFLQALRERITPEAGLYFEVFNGFGAIETGSVWSPHYEQCNYFSEHSIRRLFLQSGFQVERAGPIPADPQYLFIEARRAPDQSMEQDSLPPAAEDSVARFQSLADQKVAQWSARLANWSHLKKRVFLWGSGGKATSFLSLIPEAETIQAVVDINTNRQGKFTPRSAKPVISVDQLCLEHPDVIIISNPNYQQEIEMELRSRGLDCPLQLA